MLRADAVSNPCRPHARLRIGTVAVALISLASTGCGILIAVGTALAAAALSDSISGNKKSKGDPTVLLVSNDAASLDAIVEIDVARVDGVEPPTSTVVGVAPGQTASFSSAYDPGLHWVRVVYASGWQSRARSVNVIEHGAVTITFTHPTHNPAALEGSWFGALSAAGVGHTLGLTFDAVGSATRTLDGVPDIITGALEETSERIYRVTWGDGSVFAIIGDDNVPVAHAAVVTSSGAEGALERGATAPLPAAVDGDVVGTWTGVQVQFSGTTLVPVDVDAASATVSALQQWQGRDGSGRQTTGLTPLTVSNAAFLRFAAVAQGDAISLDLAMGLTKDKGFGAVTLVPTAGGTFPDTTRFQFLRKEP